MNVMIVERKLDQLDGGKDEDAEKVEATERACYVMRAYWEVLAIVYIPCGRLQAPKHAASTMSSQRCLHKGP
jgi:hypothetical protein